MSELGLRRLAPPLVRTAVFYRHLAPVVVGYLRTLWHDAPEAARRAAPDLRRDRA